jgi:hypothetical protein
MKNLFSLIIILILFSCGKDKVVQLPEINHSKITEINDVSAAYLFYDETQIDSIELNRKNLISTTNWLVNVDKRLTLKQVIPQIKFLQDKKGNSSHKNEKAKNYFTCHDTSINNLGFIEFTDVIYYNNNMVNLIADELEKKSKNIIIHFNALDDIKINSLNEGLDATIIHSSFSKLINDLLSIIEKQNIKSSFILSFNKKLTFQEYISFKSILSELSTNPIFISNNEFLTD